MLWLIQRLPPSIFLQFLLDRLRRPPEENFLRPQSGYHRRVSIGHGTTHSAGIATVATANVHLVAAGIGRIGRRYGCGCSCRGRLNQWWPGPIRSGTANRQLYLQAGLLDQVDHVTVAHAGDVDRIDRYNAIADFQLPTTFGRAARDEIPYRGTVVLAGGGDYYEPEAFVLVAGHQHVVRIAGIGRRRRWLR